MVMDFVFFTCTRYQGYAHGRAKPRFPSLLAFLPTEFFLFGILPVFAC